MGLYFTPFMAMCIRLGMMIALKISADRVALYGVDSFMILSMFICGITSWNMAGMMAKYFATSLAMEKVVRVLL